MTPASALVAAAVLLPAGDPAPARDALRPFNSLVGAWKATGRPDGPRDDQQKGFWAETLACGWEFGPPGPRLVVTFGKGKEFARWELRPAAGDRAYRLTAVTPAGQSRTFAGLLTAGKGKEQVLTAERTDPATGEVERLVVTLLHPNRFLYRSETKPAGAGGFARRYQVGATKEGEPFAAGPTGPECVVTGGKGTIPVGHNGKTYHVCCSGCRDAFKADPDTYVKEWEAKAKAGK